MKHVNRSFNDSKSNTLSALHINCYISPYEQKYNPWPLASPKASELRRPKGLNVKVIFCFHLKEKFTGKVPKILKVYNSCVEFHKCSPRRHGISSSKWGEGRDTRKGMLEEMELDLKETKDSKSWKWNEKYPRNGKQSPEVECSEQETVSRSMWVDHKICRVQDWKGRKRSSCKEL